MVIPEDGHLKVDRRRGCRRVTLNPSGLFRFAGIETGSGFLI
jgi:hypothetical protein